jgi:hypothetical protein
LIKTLAKHLATAPDFSAAFTAENPQIKREKATLGQTEKLSIVCGRRMAAQAGAGRAASGALFVAY